MMISDHSDDEELHTPRRRVLYPPRVDEFEGHRSRRPMATLVPEGYHSDKEDPPFAISIQGALTAASTMISKASSIFSAANSFLTDQIRFGYNSFEYDATNSHIPYGDFQAYTTLDSIRIKLAEIYHHEDVAHFVQDLNFDPDAPWADETKIPQVHYDGCFYLNGDSAASPFQTLSANASPVLTVVAGLVSPVARIIGLLMCQEGPISKIVANDSPHSHGMLKFGGPHLCAHVHVTAERLAFQGKGDSRVVSPNLGAKIHAIVSQLEARLAELKTTFEYCLPTTAWETRYGDFHCSSNVLAVSKLENSFRSCVSLIYDLSMFIQDPHQRHTVLNFIILDMCSMQEMSAQCPTLTAACMMFTAISYDFLADPTRDCVLTWWALDRALVTRGQWLEYKFTQKYEDRSHKSPFRRITDRLVDLVRTRTEEESQVAVDHYSICKQFYFRSVGLLTAAARNPEYITYSGGHEIPQGALHSPDILLPQQATAQW